MKKLIIFIIILLSLFSVFAGDKTLTYFSVSKGIYRVDYVGSTYNFTKNETSFKTNRNYTAEFGFKEPINKYFSFGISYGYNFTFFDNPVDSLTHMPMSFDFYYDRYAPYMFGSIGTKITVNDESITTVPLLKVGIGYDIDIYKDLFIGLKSSVSIVPWLYNTNISDYIVSCEVRPIEIYFAIRN